jgi:hypothetical protein
VVRRTWTGRPTPSILKPGFLAWLAACLLMFGISALDAAAKPDGFTATTVRFGGGVLSPHWPVVGHLLLRERQLTEGSTGVELVG